MGQTFLLKLTIFALFLANLLECENIIILNLTKLTYVVLFDYAMVYSRPIFLRKSSVGSGKIEGNVYPFGALFIERESNLEF